MGKHVFIPPATPGSRAPLPPLLGRSIIAGGRGGPQPFDEAPSATSFQAANPLTGAPLPTLFHDATPAEVARAGWQAWEAFHDPRIGSGPERAALLEAIAANITDLGDDLVSLTSDETGLAPTRVVAERERTTHTLRLFAALVRRGDWVHASIDTAEAARRPTPKPDLRRMLRPLGPVGVFGAGNFPLAYSTAGGDTASALAAGCPVVVKGHPSHPGAGELVARAIADAVNQCAFHPGTFSYLHAGAQRERAVGEELVRHPGIRAVGFTGSFKGGTALAGLASERPDPIPVFAEMGSTNPVFLLPGALESLAPAIAERLFASATSASGQMCTRPGLIFLPRGNDAEAFIRALADATDAAEPQPMLSGRIRRAFVARLGEVMGVAGGRGGVDVRAGSLPAADTNASAPIQASPILLRTTFETFQRHPTLHEEVFGPAVLVVLCRSLDELEAAAVAIQGSLTGTIWATTIDGPLARRLGQILEQRVGRLIYNGVPTGVEVCPSIVHGGPFPATNQPQTTAVGPMAITRFCRPVCYQNAPDLLLPPELLNANPLQINRLLNGEWTSGRVESRPRE